VGKKINEKGEEEYEGFCIDILKFIAKKINFKYEIQEEKSYGTCYPERDQCVGMYEKLVDKVDLYHACTCT
jgi:hypothetical protein